MANGVSADKRRCERKKRIGSRSTRGRGRAKVEKRRERERMWSNERNSRGTCEVEEKIEEWRNDNESGGVKN